MHSELNVPNLITLAKGLLNDKRTDVQFDMKQYAQISTYFNSDLRTDCGTVGCAIGHAPFYGIKKRANETWTSYSLRTLITPENGSQYRMGSFSNSKSKWRWCFSYDWSHCDNSKEGAAKRIIYLLQYGLPKSWNYDQNTVDLYDHITGFCPQWLKENDITLPDGDINSKQ